jgi:ABC-type uncharacterized transport system permease subunit
MTPEALDALTPEERRQVYAMLRLKVEVYTDGRMEARGVLSEDVCQVPLHVNGHADGEERLCENDRAHLYKSENTKRSEMGFSAVLGRGVSEVRFERTILC